MPISSIKTLLLIVDNCEHLIATCAELVDRLLQATAKLHIVATSREALNTAGEREWPVLPLPTPTHAATDGSAWSLPQLQTFAAAQLFIERAQAVKADLRFTDADAPLIAHLCHQLDGIPLALELAAARCKSFALPEIVARLHDRFALLSAGRRTVLLRHQTLRATIDWSYDLLSPAEAALFRCLSVFAGGWTVAAAEAVSDQRQGHPPTFDLLHQLVNKSLVVVDQQGATTRYHMLETIREYGREKLREQSESTQLSVINMQLTFWNSPNRRARSCIARNSRCGINASLPSKTTFGWHYSGGALTIITPRSPASARRYVGSG